MSGKVPTLTYTDIVAAFERAGWTAVRQRGSHIRMEKKTDSGTLKITIPAHRPDARDLQFALTLPTFARWDSSFVENIARDGVLLWAREPLPSALHAVQQRADEAPPAS